MFGASSELASVMEFGREPASLLLASWIIGQISASNQLQTSSELAPNMFGAISELASVMEFDFTKHYNAPSRGAPTHYYLQFPIQVSFFILSVCRPRPTSHARFRHRHPYGINSSIDSFRFRLSIAAYTVVQAGCCKSQ